MTDVTRIRGEALDWDQAPARSYSRSAAQRMQDELVESALAAVGTMLEAWDTVIDVYSVLGETVKHPRLGVELGQVREQIEEIRRMRG